MEPRDEDAKPPDPATSLVARMGVLRERVVPQRPEHGAKGVRRGWLLFVYLWRRWLIEDHCAGMSASLTISTLLSTVPLTGVALLLLSLMDPEAGAELLRTLFRSIVPETDRAESMAQGALDLAANVTIRNLGAWGFLVTLALAFVLFSTLERTFNRIWRAHRQRNIVVKFTMFYTLATLGPVLMLFSLAEAHVAGVRDQPFLPLVTTGVGLILLNRFLPNTKVRWKAAVIGGLVSAVLLELAKIGFGVYATRFALRTYEGVYGPLAILPILVVWSHLSWLVILLGAELTHVVQRSHAIALQGYVNRYVQERFEVRRPTGRTAARILLAICDHYTRRESGLTPELLAQRFRLPIDEVMEILDEMERQEWVMDTEVEDELLIPACPPDQILVRDVLQVFDRDVIERPRDDRLGDLFDGLDAARENIVGDTTFGDLISLPRKAPRVSEEAVRIAALKE